MPVKNLGERYNKGYMDGHRDGYAEARKAFGDCVNCYGKGYSTTLEWAGSKRSNAKLPLMRFCKCPRGVQLKEHIESL